MRMTREIIPVEAKLERDFIDVCVKRNIDILRDNKYLSITS